ncbi:RNA methyltransferase, RsmD family [Candidatus Phytoplasma oryzae]|uniref:N-6 DNA methylase n=1 Tax=Candidatus Phytoplasma oryzae TaxID=203274 RepID=A0A139JQQ5_9MOLU|nr:16S rRNA (guanine(966)-N(2))-methyltransferase RsmD [Candidatus Phytoplasma oryzae]KXT29317.1 RNA methyltransferase, RsmD family [Candidatus Phytoplasma oryzae]RAM57872.1 N-6 DNA methylase [Candidatus Phytoplasma oryzae]
MIRIISGKYKGFKLDLVPSIKTKSSSHLVRKALFDTIGGFIKETILLDLFAGTGSYGFEAISRDAKKVYLVDNSFIAFKTIHKNKKKLNLSNEKVIIFYSDAFRILKKFIQKKKRFDIVVLDPPYFSDYHVRLFQELDKITYSRSIVVYEMHHKTNFLLDNDIFSLIKTKKYGIKKLNFYKRK